MADEIAVVGLDLSGSFAAQATTDAAAAEKLATSLDRVSTASAKVKAPASPVDRQQGAITAELEQQAQLEAKIASFDAERVRNVAALQKQYKAMHDAATGDNAPGPEKGPISLNDNAGSTSILGGAVALSGAAGAAFQAGEKILSAAIELAKSAVEVAAAGVKLSVAETSKKELQSQVLKDLGGDFDASIHLAAKYGIDEDKAVSEVKKLLNAKFSQQEIQVDVKIAAALDVVEGEGKGAEYLDKLQKLKLEPKVTTKDIKGLADVGLDTKKIYEELARSMGTSVAEAEAKVKSGAIDTQKVLDAIEKTADKQFGGIADKLADSVPALLGRVKADFQHLFDSVDLGPVKDFLKNIADSFEGPSGQALKTSVTELFSTINHVFLDQFKGEEGKAKIERFMKGAAAAIHELSDAIATAKPLIEGLTDAAGGGAVEGIELLAQAIRGGVRIIDAMCLSLQLFGDALDHALHPIRDLENALEGLTDTMGDTSDSANAIGVGLDQGLAEGMQGGEALAAAEAMAESVLAKVRGVFDQHSPSREFGDIGDNNALGLANAMNDNAAPEQAGRRMAEKALRGAEAADGGGGGHGVGGGGAGAGGPGAGGSVSIVVQVQVAPGASAEEQGKAAGEAAYRAWQEMARRDARERAA